MPFSDGSTTPTPYSLSPKHISLLWECRPEHPLITEILFGTPLGIDGVRRIYHRLEPLKAMFRLLAYEDFLIDSLL